MTDTKQFTKSLEKYSHEKIDEILVCTIVEKTLSSAGIYYNLASEFEKKYNCSLYECYRHPEYLKSILEEKHRNMHEFLVESISRQLEMFYHEKPIAKFLETINS